MPGLLPYEEEEDDEEDLNDVVEVGAEDDVEGQQGCWGADIGEAARVAQEGGLSEEEALVPILNLPPIDSLPPFLLASEADLLLLLLHLVNTFFLQFSWQWSEHLLAD